MHRRRFIRNTVFAASASLLSACARAFRLPLTLMATPESGVGAERDPNGVWVEGAAYARWTPSPHNIQPWLLRIVSATECELLVDPARLLPVTDPTSAFTTMGMAMFVENLAVAVQPRGFAVRAAYVDAPLDYRATRPTLFATLRLLPSASPSAIDRQVILERKTSRLTYDGHPVADSALEALASLSTTHGHTLRWSSDDAMVSWIIDLNRFTLFSDLDDAPTRTELRRWIRPTDDEAAAKQDGLWAHCLRFPGWLLKAFFDDHKKWGHGWRASICGKMLVRGMHGTRTVAWWSAFTVSCLAGSSRYQRYQIAAAPTPSIPKTGNIQRHPNRSINHAATGGVRAPPHRPPLRNAPKTVERSVTGTQREKAAAVAGDRAASSPPNMNRIASSDVRFQAAPVRAVKADHARIARLINPREPKRSATAPHGACPNAYARLKMLRIRPICC